MSENYQKRALCTDRRPLRDTIASRDRLRPMEARQNFAVHYNTEQTVPLLVHRWSARSGSVALSEPASTTQPFEGFDRYISSKKSQADQG